ncbi:hypothetical protein BDN70DRAFT_280433 [Pholiota conissans]|uniref:Secreted protein n=1 Tax=Pholiota conissans TaxID=109636 RepID=A0A9P6CY61_9AGAR|nr:hypothetical protein BDN70DRAFT_280433 [Pholiota conissans]
MPTRASQRRHLSLFLFILLEIFTNPPVFTNPMLNFPRKNVLDTPKVLLFCRLQDSKLWNISGSSDPVQAHVCIPKFSVLENFCLRTHSSTYMTQINLDKDEA